MIFKNHSFLVHFFFCKLEWRGSGEEDSRRWVQKPHRWSDGQHSGGRRGRVLGGRCGYRLWEADEVKLVKSVVASSEREGSPFPSRNDLKGQWEMYGVGCEILNCRPDLIIVCTKFRGFILAILLHIVLGRKRSLHFARMKWRNWMSNILSNKVLMVIFSTVEYLFPINV